MTQFIEWDQLRVTDPVTGSNKPHSAAKLNSHKETEKEPASSSEVETISYETCTEGPVTYFRYYFESDPNVAFASEPMGYPVDASLSRSVLTNPQLLVGAGALTVAAISTFLVIDAPKPSPPSSNSGSSTQLRSPQQSKQASSSTSLKPVPAQPSAFQPENSSTQRSLKRVQSEATPKVSAKRNSRTTSALNPQPLTSPKLRSLVPPVLSSTGVASTVRAPQSVRTRAIRSAQPNVRQSATAQVRRSSQSASPKSPLNPQTPVSVETAAPSLDSRPLETIAPPESSAPFSQSSTSASPEWTTDLGKKTAEAMRSLTMNTIPVTVSPASKELTPQSGNASPEGIQDFLNLSQKASSKTAFMPLTQQAVAEVTDKTKVEQYTVRHVDPQQYQREWLQMNKLPENTASVSIAPTYGFIDYERQVIVVVQ